MIYTLGYKPVYRSSFKAAAKRNEPLRKLGRREDYNGGTVWRTAEEVFEYIQANQPRLADYGVYEVDADWEKDTAPNQEGEGHPFHDLLVTSVITREILNEEKDTSR